MRILLTWDCKFSLKFPLTGSKQSLMMARCPSNLNIITLIARFMGSTWGPSGADRTQVGPMLAPWTYLSGLFMILPLNSLRPRQDRCHFADAILKWILVNENVWILMKINPELVQLKAWCQPGDKPLSEPMMVGLPMHIYVTQPQWVN